MIDMILNFKTIILLLIGSGLFEISPIPFNPVSLSLGWIGKKMNKDVKNDIELMQKNMDEMKKDIEKVQHEVQDHKIESWRRDILDYADDLMSNKCKTKENFDNIIRIHDKYEKYITSNGLMNGQVDFAFEYIMEKYRECIDNGSFAMPSIRKKYNENI